MTSVQQQQQQPRPTQPAGASAGAIVGAHDGEREEGVLLPWGVADRQSILADYEQRCRERGWLWNSMQDFVDAVGIELLRRGLPAHGDELAHRGKILFFTCAPHARIAQKTVDWRLLASPHVPAPPSAPSSTPRRRVTTVTLPSPRQQTNSDLKWFARRESEKSEEPEGDPSVEAAYASRMRMFILEHEALERRSVLMASGGSVHIEHSHVLLSPLAFTAAAFGLTIPAALSAGLVTQLCVWAVAAAVAAVIWLWEPAVGTRSAVSVAKSTARRPRVDHCECLLAMWLGLLFLLVLPASIMGNANPQLGSLQDSIPRLGGYLFLGSLWSSGWLYLWWSHDSLATVAKERVKLMTLMPHSLGHQAKLVTVAYEGLSLCSFSFFPAFPWDSVHRPPQAPDLPLIIRRMMEIFPDTDELATIGFGGVGMLVPFSFLLLAGVKKYGSLGVQLFVVEIFFDMLTFPVIKTLSDVFACTRGTVWRHDWQNSNISRVCEDSVSDDASCMDKLPNEPCWQTRHLWAVVGVMLLLVPYYIASIYLRTSAQQERSAVSIDGAYSVIVFQVKIVLALAASGWGDCHPYIVIAAVETGVIAMLLLTTRHGVKLMHRLRRALNCKTVDNSRGHCYYSNVRSLNAVRIVGLAAAGCNGVFATYIQSKYGQEVCGTKSEIESTNLQEATGSYVDFFLLIAMNGTILLAGALHVYQSVRRDRGSVTEELEKFGVEKAEREVDYAIVRKRLQQITTTYHENRRKFNAIAAFNLGRRSRNGSANFWRGSARNLSSGLARTQTSVNREKAAQKTGGMWKLKASLKLSDSSELKELERPRLKLVASETSGENSSRIVAQQVEGVTLDLVFQFSDAPLWVELCEVDLRKVGGLRTFKYLKEHFVETPRCNCNNQAHNVVLSFHCSHDPGCLEDHKATIKDLLQISILQNLDVTGCWESENYNDLLIELLDDKDDYAMGSRDCALQLDYRGGDQGAICLPHFIHLKAYRKTIIAAIKSAVRGGSRELDLSDGPQQMEGEMRPSHLVVLAVCLQKQSSQKQIVRDIEDPGKDTEELKSDTPPGNDSSDAETPQLNELSELESILICDQPHILEHSQQWFDLVKNSSVTALDEFGAKNIAEFTFFCESISQLPRLSKLVLCNCNLQDGAVRTLLTHFVEESHHHAELTELDLSRNKALSIPDPSLLCSLTSLNLSGCGIRSDDTESSNPFGSLLSNDSRLQCLNIAGCTMDELAVQAASNFIVSYVFGDSVCSLSKLNVSGIPDLKAAIIRQLLANDSFAGAGLARSAQLTLTVDFGSKNTTTKLDVSKRCLVLKDCDLGPDDAVLIAHWIQIMAVWTQSLEDTISKSSATVPLFLDFSGNQKLAAVEDALLDSDSQKSKCWRILCESLHRLLIAGQLQQLNLAGLWQSPSPEAVKIFAESLTNNQYEVNQMHEKLLLQDPTSGDCLVDLSRNKFEQDSQLELAKMLPVSARIGELVVDLGSSKNPTTSLGLTSPDFCFKNSQSGEKYLSAGDVILLSGWLQTFKLKTSGGQYCGGLRVNIAGNKSAFAANTNGVAWDYLCESLDLVERLDVSSCGIDSKRAKQLLDHNQKLLELDLANNPIDPDAELGQKLSLSGIKTLKLDLGGTGLTTVLDTDNGELVLDPFKYESIRDGDLLFLTEWLKADRSRTTSLTLKGNKLGDHTDSLGPLLSCVRIVTIDLCDCHLSPSSMADVKFPHTLTTLDLSGNAGLSDGIGGWATVCEALQTTSIQRLTISKCKIDSANVGDLRAVGGETLRHIDLSKNPVTQYIDRHDEDTIGDRVAHNDQPFIAFFESLNSAISTINLYRCGLQLTQPLYKSLLKRIHTTKTPLSIRLQDNLLSKNESSDGDWAGVWACEDLVAGFKENENVKTMLDLQPSVAGTVYECPPTFDTALAILLAAEIEEQRSDSIRAIKSFNLLGADISAEGVLSLLHAWKKAPDVFTLCGLDGKTCELQWPLKDPEGRADRMLLAGELGGHTAHTHPEVTSIRLKKSSTSCIPTKEYELTRDQELLDFSAGYGLMCADAVLLGHWLSRPWPLKTLILTNNLKIAKDGKNAIGKALTSTQCNLDVLKWNSTHLVDGVGRWEVVLDVKAHAGRGSLSFARQGLGIDDARLISAWAVMCSRRSAAADKDDYCDAITYLNLSDNPLLLGETPHTQNTLKSWKKVCRRVRQSTISVLHLSNIGMRVEPAIVLGWEMDVPANFNSAVYLNVLRNPLDVRCHFNQNDPAQALTVDVSTHLDRKCLEDDCYALRRLSQGRSELTTIKEDAKVDFTVAEILKADHGSNSIAEDTGKSNKVKRRLLSVAYTSSEDHSTTTPQSHTDCKSGNWSAAQVGSQLRWFDLAIIAEDLTLSAAAQLTEVDISGNFENAASEKDSTYFGQMVKAWLLHPSLQALRAENAQLSPLNLSDFTQAVGDMQKELARNRVAASGSGKKISDSAIHAKLYFHGNPKLLEDTTQGAAPNPMDAWGGLLALFKNMNRETHLHVLDVSNCELSDKAIEVLVNTDLIASCLTDLDVSGNHIGADAKERLASQLPLGSLQRLVIDLGQPGYRTVLDSNVHYLSLTNRNMMLSDFNILKGWLDEKDLQEQKESGLEIEVGFNFLQNGLEHDTKEFQKVIEVFDKRGGCEAVTMVGISDFPCVVDNVDPRHQQQQQTNRARLGGPAYMHIDTGDRKCPLFDYSHVGLSANCVATEGDVRLLLHELVDGRSLGEQLEELSLSIPGTHLSGPGLQALVGATIQPHCRLKTLKLVNCGLQGSRNPETWPDMPGGVIGDWDLLAAAIDPRKGSQLRTLDISDNPELLFFTTDDGKSKEHHPVCMSDTFKSLNPKFFNLLFKLIVDKCDPDGSEKIQLMAFHIQNIGLGDKTADILSQLLQKTSGQITEQLKKRSSIGGGDKAQAKGLLSLNLGRNSLSPESLAMLPQKSLAATISFLPEKIDA